MTETIDLTHILILLAAGVLAVPVFHWLGLGSVLGFLFAGAIIGPWGLGVIHQVQEIQHIAEFGVVFLLFVIGIELNFKRLWAMKRLVFGLGTAQVILTGIALAGLALLLGVSKETAIVIGFGLALSSTAFGLQILTERDGLKSVAGRTSFSILLLQDLSVVPLLALVSFLAHDAPLAQGVEFTLLNTLFVVGAVILAGRFVLTPVLRLIAHSHNAEVFVAAAILAVLGTAWLMEEIGLSMALGAFLAGLMLADSQYRHQITADIQPFRGILLGLFFMSVGMSVDFGLLMQKAPLVLGLVGGLLSIKAAMIWALCRIAGTNNGSSIRAALLLSQSGEFGFVLFGLALTTGLMDMEIFQMLTLVIAMSMATTPFMAIAGEKIERALGKRKTQDAADAMALDDEQFVILAGFGRMGKRIAKILDAAKVPYLALDNDPDCVTKARKEGFSVIYGDAGRYDVLNRMEADNANVFVITIDEAAVAERLVHIMRQHYPETHIYARGRDHEHCEKLSKAGATLPVSENLEASLTLSGAVLDVNSIPSEEVTRLLEEFREVYYGDMDKIGIT